MPRVVVRLLLLALVLGVWWFAGPPAAKPPGNSPVPVAEKPRLPAGGSSARQSWGRMDTLADHFARHGGEFNARDAEDYAAQAAALLDRARATGLPAKRDQDGSIRVFDPATGAFGAYNRDGTTRTFFKPGDRTYLDRQPGARIDLRTAR